MSKSGSSQVEEVKVKEGHGESEDESRASVEVMASECVDSASPGCEIRSVNMAEALGPLPDGADKMRLHQIDVSSGDGERGEDKTPAENPHDDDNPKSDDIYDIDRETDYETEAESSCFKIDKVYTMTDEQNDLQMSDADKDDKNDKSDLSRDKEEEAAVAANGGTDVKAEVVVSAKPEVLELKLKEEKPIRPRTAPSGLVKVPSLTGVGGVRVLGGGVRGPNMPLIVSMGAGNPAIPLLPAGLPPGRYVILPGTCTSTKTSTCATVTTTSTSLNPRVATSIAPTASHGLAAAAAAAATASVGAQRSMTASPITPVSVPPPTGGSKMYTRERGRRKSYTAGEKLAMIEAVEAGQRKSAVADRFGVAPSTLACILAQKHKIRAEQDNLARRRVRHGKYQLREEGRTKVQTIAPAMRLNTSAEHPFTHFLAPLTAPTPAVFDTQPEEIIAVPDLMERLTGSSSGMTSGNKEGNSDGDEDGLSAMDSITQDSESLHEPQELKSKSFQQSSQLAQEDGSDDTSRPDVSEQPASPSQGTQGLVGPYLLKKESHCTTVLDQLLRDDTYTDVTLTAEGQSLRAHRIVLCLASPYFRQVLSREINVQSVVVLRDVKFAELRNIINFIYTGEATVDATELESFMRTAETLEISSLCDGQKCIASRGALSQGNTTSGFTIGDFEKLVGAKRTRKESSPTPSKSRRLSGEDQSSRCSSAEPAATTNPLALIKEEPFCESTASSTAHLGTHDEVKPRETDHDSSEGTGGGGRERRESSGSIGGFASIAGLQKDASESEHCAQEIFISTSESSLHTQLEETETAEPCAPDISVIPGRCPYCPHLTQKFEGVPMMRHLLVSHPCKPAFPCDNCWRVFVKRANFKGHQQKCQAASF